MMAYAGMPKTADASDSAAFIYESSGALASEYYIALLVGRRTRK